MSAENSSSNTTSKRQPKDLSTGQTIHLTSQEDRMLRRVYDQWQGLAKRQQLEVALRGLKDEFHRLEILVPIHVKNLKTDASSFNFKNYHEGDVQTEVEKNSAEYLRTREKIKSIEDKLSRLNQSDHKIKPVDIEVILRDLGCPRPMKDIEFMVWEVDENLDGEVDWEEFQLTYYRNVLDQSTHASGTEPCGFFSILEFLTFDESRKGYIIEDNCMEILFARYGSEKLEKELQFLFGSQLRSAGGDGTLTLSGYLAAILSRTGRRSIIPPFTAGNNRG